jgi:hypothetical protein
MVMSICMSSQMSSVALDIGSLSYGPDKQHVVFQPKIITFDSGQ